MLRILLHKYPLSVATVASSTAIVSAAAITEYRTEQWSVTALQHRRQLHQQQHGFSDDQSNIVTYDDKIISLPREYHWDNLQAYWSARPFTAYTRFGQVLYELLPIASLYVRDFVVFPSTLESDIESKQLYIASRLREAFTNLGPAFVKAGQQLSIRPDLVPPVVLKELQKLCDSVRPVPDEVAFQIMREELGVDHLDELVDEIQLVAAASLGQVYRAKLRSNGAYVAIKVQRPQTRRSFSLDLFLLHQMGYLVDAFTSIFTNQPPFHGALYESFARGSYAELDYENEARNQLHFQKCLTERRVRVVVPDVYFDLTTERVLTSQWIDGVKLADSSKEKIRELIPVGIELFLTQLLEIGTFHADPHPGNLLVTNNGQLCLLDFGLCVDIDEKSRIAMTKAIAHLVSRDFDTLVTHDTKELGLLPEDYDTTELKPLMTKILTVGLVESGSDMRTRKRKLMEISNELNEVFFRYPFRVPPFFALITRGLGLLEGIALTGDPDFDIFQASAPYARRRALAVLGINLPFRPTRALNKTVSQ